MTTPTPDPAAEFFTAPVDERKAVDLDAMLAEANVPEQPNVLLRWRGHDWHFRSLWTLPSSTLVSALELNPIDGARLIELGFVGFAGSGEAPAEFPAVPLNAVPVFIQGWLDACVAENAAAGE